MSRISRLTTLDSTGRRTKMSKRFMARCSLPAGVRPPARSGVQAELARINRIVDHDGIAVLKLQLARRHDPLAGIETVDDLHHAALPLAHTDELLLDDQRQLRTGPPRRIGRIGRIGLPLKSEEHTSELQSLM